MKKHLPSLVFLLLSGFFAFAQPASKDLTKSFNVEAHDRLVLNLPGETSIVAWEKNHVQVVMKIEIPNTSQTILDELIRVGRYDLSSEAKDGGLEISSPNKNKEVRIRGNVLAEKITYTVYMPGRLDTKIQHPKVEVALKGK